MSHDRDPGGRSAAGWLGALLDPGSFASWDLAAAPAVPAEGAYADQLADAERSSGADEAIVSGQGLVAGHRVAVACSDFGFLAGSLGTGAALRLAATLARATHEGLPLVLGPASGGTRMQEGTPAFVRMLDIADRVAAHRRAGLPVLVHLRHPTFGGAFASWGSLGTLTLAEPDAHIGFLGPKVYEALHGEAFPAGVQTAEHLHEVGLVDGVATAAEAREVLTRLLGLLSQRTRHSDVSDLVAHAPRRTSPEGSAGEPDGGRTWAAVRATRRADRPGVRDLLAQEASDTVLLSGTGEGEVGPATVLALTRLGGEACVLVGQDRRAQRERPLNVGDLRVTRRGIALAEELGLPLVTVIDTPGAELSAAAESAGVAGQIARCLVDFAALRSPSVAVLLGEGAGGGALALLGADRVVAAEHAWLTPLPPEGASAIVHGTPDRAAELAGSQRAHSHDLLREGTVDRVVPEHPDAADEAPAFLARLARVIGQEARTAASGPGRRPRSGRVPTGHHPHHPRSTPTPAWSSREGAV